MYYFEMAEKKHFLSVDIELCWINIFNTENLNDNYNINNSIFDWISDQYWYADIYTQKSQKECFPYVPNISTSTKLIWGIIVLNWMQFVLAEYHKQSQF